MYIIQTSRSKWQPYNISVPLDLKVTKLILNIIYVWKKIYISSAGSVGGIVFNVTFSNILGISLRSVLLVEETGVPGLTYTHVLRLSLDLPYEKR
jgi:hypothetical protein